MSWVTVIWSGLGAACITLAVQHLLVWYYKRSSWASLFLALTAAGTAAMAFLELRMMHAVTPGAFAVSLRWLHVPALLVILACFGFVRTYLQAGRPWLGWLGCILRGIALVLNFLVGQNITFLEVVSLRHVSFLGESVSVGEGILNPWTIVGQTSLVVLVCFNADAAITVWRRGDRRAALWVGGSILFFALFASAQFPLILLERANLPVIPSVASAGVLSVMAASLSRDLLRAAKLSQDLRDSEARFRDLFGGAQEGIYRTSPAGKFLMANPALAAMLGYGSADDLVLGIEDSARQVWVSPEERTRFMQLVETQGTVSGYECRFHRRDGARIWVSLSSRAVQGPDGRVAHIEGFVQDITMRREAQRALRESSARLEALLFSMADWIWEMDESCRYTYCSPKGCELLGDIVGKTPFDSAPPDEAHRMGEMLAEAVAHKAPIKDLEHWHFTKNGERVCLLANGVPILDEKGDVRGFRGVDRDITQRKLVEQALFESEEHFRHAAEAAQFGTFEIDHAAGSTHCSPELLALYGLPASDILELDPDLVPRAIHPNDRATYLAAMRAARDPLGSGLLNHVFRIVRADGQVRWMQALGQTVFHVDGPERAPLRSNGIILDVTKSKEGELKLEQQRNELGRMARVSMLGQLASSLAHELNQPLGAIMRNAEAAELFLEDPSPDCDELRVILSDIRNDDARAGAVIDRMRSLMRHRAIEYQTLDIAALAAEVIDLVHPDADLRFVRMGLEADSDLPLVHGDRVQLQQVIINLLLNAMEAVHDNPPADRQVTVRARAAGASVEVTVIDNGHGISENILPVIFEPFLSSRSDGLGMGLAISLAIIEAHGGRLWAENAEGRGARFTISLPAVQGGAAT